MQSSACQTPTFHRLWKFRDKVTGALPFPRARSLARRKTLTLHLPHGSRLRCVTGILWITSTPAREDIILQAGETWTNTCGKTAIVLEALQDARFEIPPHA